MPSCGSRNGGQGDGDGDGDAKGAYKRLESLHHVEDSIRRFVDRDLIALLRESRTLRSASIGVGSIHVATNRIRIELRSSLTDDTSPGLWIEFDELHDALIAGVAGPAWVNLLVDEQSRVLSMALIGMFKMCGVEWIRARPVVGGSQKQGAVTQPQNEAWFGPLVGLGEGASPGDRSRDGLNAPGPVQWRRGELAAVGGSLGARANRGQAHRPLPRRLQPLSRARPRGSVPRPRLAATPEEGDPRYARSSPFRTVTAWPPIATRLPWLRHPDHATP